MSDHRRDVFVLLFVQVTIFILFGYFVRYDESQKGENTIYFMFQDIHVMVFLGFGFLMAFLKKYGYSSIGFNFFLAAILVQWAILCRGFFHLSNLKIPISVESLVEADIAVASVLISMGVLLGQTTLLQLIIMGIIEIAVYQCNFYVGDEILKLYLKIADAGASIFVHTFGAYFGLAASFALSRFKRKNDIESDKSLESSNYTSDLFAMIGTIFLWIYWPSFNSAELSGDDQHRAIINTYLSLAASCATAFAFSAILTPDTKFDMVHVQNSTLAGGVAIGASVNMMIQPYGAIFLGMLAGALSVIGYNYITPWIDRNLHIHDTCGVHNLHGMPGVLAALVSAILAAIATESQYHTGLYDIFPARAPTIPSFNQDVYRHIQGDGRTAMQQAGYQILALIMTVVVAIVTGFLTGISNKTLCFHYSFL
ncbi:ammonium transporter Rh type B isoform X1 [Agrilus planipennis]|uniref:Ammonium transporter Rh type B isoform X1 n=1 Tax=Agrilus planipennis TaxID=224129 RepID=A0A1W4XBN0_AGRPL|nr:ammonium transporter Rh type B isoform X1 [Agrilus planipennis]